jgi:GxxExxY protein
MSPNGLAQSSGELSEIIIGSSFKVHRTLGAGFLEKVYENALMLELAERGLRLRQQVPLSVSYAGRTVGEYFADLLVEDTVICELKACERLSAGHEVQLVNYLAATGFETGLLINFGARVSVKRKFRLYLPGVKTHENRRN